MYTLLWNYGTQQFSSKDYRACVDIYAAALAYADAAAKAVIARQLALAHLALNELDRSPAMQMPWGAQLCLHVHTTLNPCANTMQGHSRKQLRPGIFGNAEACSHCPVAHS